MKYFVVSTTNYTIIDSFPAEELAKDFADVLQQRENRGVWIIEAPSNDAAEDIIERFLDD
jgi:hypothetical protein